VYAQQNGLFTSISAQGTRRSFGSFHAEEYSFAFFTHGNPYDYEPGWALVMSAAWGRDSTLDGTAISDVIEYANATLRTESEDILGGAGSARELDDLRHGIDGDTYPGYYGCERVIGHDAAGGRTLTRSYNDEHSDTWRTTYTDLAGQCLVHVHSIECGMRD
jgi:hypothetical protein